jgi:hypothetical protein
MVDVDITRQSNVIRTVAAGAQYTRQEIRAAAMANRPIDTLKIATVRRAIAEKENKISFVGDAANGLDGLTNATGIQTAAFTKTMTQMAPGDITNALRDARMKLTTVIGFAGVKPALVLPATQYEYLAGTRFNDYDARTILNVINDYGWFSKILPTDALKGVGENNTDVALLVNTDPSVVEMLLPLDVTMLPQENYSLYTKLGAEERFGSVAIKIPYEILRIDGI